MLGGGGGGGEGGVTCGRLHVVPSFYETSVNSSSYGL